MIKSGITIAYSSPKSAAGSSSARKSVPARKPGGNTRIFSLAEMTIAFVIIGLIAGAALVARELLENSEIRSQISQLEQFDSSIATFYEKYNGLPGDLLSVSAQRYGLPAGDGTPGHSDGDGKISPCSLGWQWNLGCETALFWAQLYQAGLISQNFSGDGRFIDGRIIDTASMAPYIPASPIGEGIYVAVWNTDSAQASPASQIPYGNYYEISRITGVLHGKMVDDSNALTPLQARAIDEKMDDGSPRSGRVLVNGDATWPDDAWGAFARTGERNCVTPDHTYNSYEYFKANRPLCHLAIAITCCAAEEEK